MRLLPILACACALVQPPFRTSRPRRALRSTSDDAALQSLRERVSELRLDAPSPSPRPKYRVTTMHGFLNVHTDPTDPHRLDNCVGRLPDGEVVLALSENPEGDWILHDHGGWSIRVFEGFEWLVPADSTDP